MSTLSGMVGLNMSIACSSPVGTLPHTSFPNAISYTTPHIWTSVDQQAYSGHPSQILVHICTPIPKSTLTIPKCTTRTGNTISAHPLQPHVSTSDHFLHWMTPYGLAKLHHISQFLPPHIVVREQVVLVQAVNPKTLGNYRACYVP